MPPTVRVAVVGSGLAGLATAYLLQVNTETKGQILDVHLFERNASIGMDSESVTVPNEGQQKRVDVPMRAFSEGYYPALVKFYRYLDIPFKASFFSFSFGRSQPSLTRTHGPEPEFLYSGLHSSGHHGDKKFSMPHRSTVSMLCFVLSILWSYAVLNVLVWYHVGMGHTRNASHRVSQQTFGEWLDHAGLRYAFVKDLLLPLFSSIMTTDVNTVRDIPAAEVLEYIRYTFFYDHYTVQGGVSQVVAKLAAPLCPENIHLNTSITDIVPIETEGRHQIKLRHHQGPSTQELVFDHVIFATQATQASKMIQQYVDHLARTPFSTTTKALHDRALEQASELRKLVYKPSTVVCHTDTSVLAPEKKDWRDLNLVTPLPTSGDGPGFTMATHIVWQSGDMTVMQSTNPLPWLLPSENKRISFSRFERFVLTMAGKSARTSFFISPSSRSNSIHALQLGPLQGPCLAADGSQLPGFWFSGSWSYGVPLLEGLFPHLL